MLPSGVLQECRLRRVPVRRGFDLRGRKGCSGDRIRWDKRKCRQNLGREKWAPGMVCVMSAKASRLMLRVATLWVELCPVAPEQHLDFDPGDHHGLHSIRQYQVLVTLCLFCLVGT